MGFIEMDSPVLDIQQHTLNDKWVLYHHLPSDKNWTLSGYTVIEKELNTMEKIITLNENIPEKMIKYSMLFLMRSHITPIWEDKHNIAGGCFSYKVINKYVEQVWRQMVYMTCGESLVVDPNHSSYINGITISPKKNFCILKIWLKDNSCQDPQMIGWVEYLTKNGVMFKSHQEN